MSENNSRETVQYGNAASMMRAHGILSIVFGSLGVIIAVFFTLLFAFGVTDPNSSYQVFSALVMAFLVLIFGVVPYAYLVVSGIYLLKNPRPTVARVLTIINLVVGVFYNLVVLIFAIISLTQISDYEHGYKKR